MKIPQVKSTIITLEKNSPLTAMSNISSIKNLDTSSFIVDNSMSFSFLNNKLFEESKTEIENSRRNLNLRRSKVTTKAIQKNTQNPNQYKLKEGIQHIKIQYERTLSKKRNDSKETIKTPIRLPLKRKKMLQDLVSSNRTSPEKSREKVDFFQNSKQNTKRVRSIHNHSPCLNERKMFINPSSPSKMARKSLIRPSEIDNYINKKDEIFQKINYFTNKETKNYSKVRRSPLKAKATKGFYMKKKKRKTVNLNSKLRKDSFGISKRPLGNSTGGLTQTFNDFLSKAKKEMKGEKVRESSR